MLVEKIIYPVLFDPNRSFKRENTLSLAKELFITVSMACRSRLVVILQGKVLCFGTRQQVACLQNVYCVKRSENTCRKNDISNFVWHKSFVQVVK